MQDVNIQCAGSLLKEQAAKRQDKPLRQRKLREIENCRRNRQKQL